MPGFELFGDEEREQVQQVLNTGVLMRYGFNGMRGDQWKAKELEEGLAKRMGVKYAQLVSSGTAALTVALASAGVGAGDEVIMPTFTFVASFESVMAIGAVPILVDIDDTLTLDPDSVTKAITPKTKVVMPVHMCGSMAQLKELKLICTEHNLLLLEDACQAIGGTYEGRPLGSYGDLGCFSFDYVKTMTCGEGGGIITNNGTYAKHADQFSDHGHDHVGSDRGAETHPFLGYNFRISELNAAVGVAQLQKLDAILSKQKKYYGIIREALSQVQGITFRRVPEEGEENYSFVNFFMPDESLARKAAKALKEVGVDGCFYWYDNNWHYIKKWDHLKTPYSLGKLPLEILDGLTYLEDAQFTASNHWMGKTLSCLVKMSWTEEEVHQRARKMVVTLQNLL